MKTSFQIEINQVYRKIFFPEERIKDKYKIIEILLEATRYILYNAIEDKVNGSYKMIVHTAKMNRLFFVSSTKIYSIAFPFNIYYNNSDIVIRYKNQFEINSYTISTLLGLIKSPNMNSANYLDFADPIADLESEQNINYWILLRDLLMLEDGYIRYDKDEDGFKEASQKNQKHRHPLNHIDIFYTTLVSFKLGLEQDYLDIDLIDTLDVKTDCRYLKTAPDS